MKKLMSKIYVMGVLMGILTGCGGMPTFESFQSKTPKLDIKEYFNGPLEAWGFLQDRSGEVTRRFHVTMVGSWQGDQGKLEEHFIFDDGEKQTRTWTFDMKGPDQFIGKAADVIGIAEGRQEGNALNMQYVLRIPVKGSTYDITINDWLILLDEKRLMNISELTKFGFNVGKLTIFFEKK